MTFHDKSGNSVLSELKSRNSGLFDVEVQNRQREFGFNRLIEKKKVNPFLLFLSQFNSFIIFVLIFAIIFSLFVGEYVDSIVIAIILVFNAIFGFIQEYRAEKSIENLKKLASLKASVIRNGNREVVDSEEIVPGDILILEEGMRVPADARIIDSNSLMVAEAALTGESKAAVKVSKVVSARVINDMANMVFSSTDIISGTGKAVVVKTGMGTEIGKIAGMVSEAKEESTPLQKDLKKLGKKVVWITLALCVLVFIEGLFTDNLFALISQGEWISFLEGSEKWLLTAISLAVAAVPEGLPAVVTIALAIGVKRMLKKKSLIRRLPSVETLGEATFICTDKTGTLTENKMTVRKAFVSNAYFSFTGQGYDSFGTVVNDKRKLADSDKLLFLIGSVCNNSELNMGEIKGDPTEAALKISTIKAGVDIRGYKRIKEIPFDSKRKMMSVVVKGAKGNKFVFSKGAPEVLIDKCTHYYDLGKRKKLTFNMKRKFLKETENMASDALRVLGFAYKKYSSRNEESGLVFVGLQGMMDPPHPEVSGAIKKCYSAGIDVMMITGDNIVTAKGIGEAIGLKGNAMLGADFAELSEKEKLKALKKVRIFARVEPEHKMDIVDLLQKQGDVVAMTGDGVNDAPAIKSADLGIAMGSGTDVSKESSDMVLLDDNFTSIVNAVEEGRGIYQNIKKFVNYLLSSNIAEVMVIVLAILFGWPLPMTAIMILWLNLVTDGLPALALSVDPNPKNIMSMKPKKKGEQILSGQAMLNIFVIGMLITMGVLGVFYWSWSTYADVMRAQTIAFTSLVLFEIIRLQLIRSEYGLSLFSNKWLVYALGTSFILQAVVIYSPLNKFFEVVPLTLLELAAIVIGGIFVGLLTWFFRKLGFKFNVHSH